MSAEIAVFDRLSNFAGLTALVSNRIFPNIIPPKKAMPAVTYQLITYQPTLAMGSNAGVSRSRIQVSCFGRGSGSASAYASAKGVRDQVVAALDRFRGTAGGVVVQAIYILNEVDLYDDNAKVDGVAIDFDVVFEE